MGVECELLCYGSTSSPKTTMFTGPIIKTRFLGPTNHRQARIKATHKRDSEVTWSVTINWHYGSTAEENHYNAACALMRKDGFFSGPFTVVGRGHDHDAYYWLVNVDTTAAQEAI